MPEQSPVVDSVDQMSLLLCTDSRYHLHRVLLHAMYALKVEVV